MLESLRATHICGVTFWESNPFYGEKTDLSAVFEGLDQPLRLAGQEGESAQKNEVTGSSSPAGQQQPLITASIPMVVPEVSRDRSWPKPNEEKAPRVYSRRQRIEK